MGNLKSAIFWGFLVIILTSTVDAQITIEAEDTRLGANSHIRDYYVGIYGTGERGWIRFPWEEEGEFEVTIIARGEEFEGWPWLGIEVGEEILNSVEVNSEEWKSYSLYCVFPQGVDSVDVVFLNDHWVPGIGDRNLYVDKIILQKDVCTVSDSLWVEWEPPEEDEAGYPITVGDLYGYRIYIASDPAGLFQRFGPEFIPPEVTDYRGKIELEEGIWWLYMTAFRKTSTGECGPESKPSNLVSFQIKREERGKPLPPVIIRVEIKIGK